MENKIVILPEKKYKRHTAETAHSECAKTHTDTHLRKLCLLLASLKSGESSLSCFR